MSTTIESQPQRAMLSADAELGMPSQPLTATPPFFQIVFSLFSRKTSLPIERFPGATMGMAARPGQSDVALDPPCKGAGICLLVAHDVIGEPVSTSPDQALSLLRRQAAPFHRVIHDAEQEESDAAAHHGQGRMGRAERPR